MKNFILFSSILFLNFFPILAQTYEIEKQEDPYLPVAIENRVTTPSFGFTNASIFTTQVNINDAGDNLINDAANEPSLAIDPTNPLRMVIGWRQFENIESNFRQAGIAYTNDGGVTWNKLEPIESHLFRSDPVLDSDSEGNFYYNSLNTAFECHVFKSNDLEDWSDKTFAHGGDKQWMVIDKTEQTSNGQIYAYWSTFNTPPCSFSRSVDQGLSYEDCEPLPSYVRLGTMSIDPEGNLYIGTQKNTTFAVLKSTTAKNPNQVVSWDQNVTVELSGKLALSTELNPSGLLGQVWVATDHSETSNNGNVYLLAPVNRDNGDPSDIMFSRSTDGGNTWSTAIKINDDPSLDNWNWFGSLSVAPNGRIDATWVDTRDAPGTYLSSLYYSYSEDGGLTWSINERLSDSFDPHIGWPNQSKIGDYYHMISDNEGAHLAWAATFNGEQDVYYSYISPFDAVDIDELNHHSFNLKLFPNPTSQDLTIQFSNQQTGNITIEIYSSMGEQLLILDENSATTGNQIVHITNRTLSQLERGMYFLKVTNTNGNYQFKKVVLSY